MTSACLTLMHRAARPAWPWASAGTGLLVEAFPAAQLKSWGLPYVRYNGRDPHAASTRLTIVRAIAQRVTLGSFQSVMLQNADALDAVICAFAALAATRNSVLASPVGAWLAEGWIAVHS